MSSKLVKARLMSCDSTNDQDNIDFMFNPTELKFSKKLKTNSCLPKGQTQAGTPKLSFSGFEPTVLTISKILFDTYEEGTSVLPYINQFKKALDPVNPGTIDRPPAYRFWWGNNYIRRCFIKALDYSLILFLADGTPVRAVVESLVLEEVDDPTPSSSLTLPTKPNRAGDSRYSRMSNATSEW